MIIIFSVDSSFSGDQLTWEFFGAYFSGKLCVSSCKILSSLGLNNVEHTFKVALILPKASSYTSKYCKLKPLKHGMCLWLLRFLSISFSYRTTSFSEFFNSTFSGAAFSVGRPQRLGPVCMCDQKEIQQTDYFLPLKYLWCSLWLKRCVFHKNKFWWEQAFHFFLFR